MPQVGTKRAANFSNAKGKTLSTFIDFFLCGGQRQVAAAGLLAPAEEPGPGRAAAVRQDPGRASIPTPARWPAARTRPSSSGQLTILLNAPYPSPCDKLGAPLNCTVVNGKAKSTGGGTGGSTPNPSSSATSSTGTGPVGTSTTGPATATGGSGGSVAGQVVNVASDSSGRAPLGVMTAIAIIIAIVAPPALGIWLRRRKLRVSR